LIATLLQKIKKNFRNIMQKIASKISYRYREIVKKKTIKFN